MVSKELENVKILALKPFIVIQIQVLVNLVPLVVDIVMRIIASYSQVCNRTHNYFINGVCADSCVDGTFILSDLVTCQSCSVE